MKYLISILLSICFFSATAQNPVKKDTVYYLFDPAHLQIKELVWDVNIDGPVTYYTLKCSCLQDGQNPIYIRKKQTPKQTISNDSFKKINAVTLKSLIALSKKDLDMKNEPATVYFFIEKKQQDYTMFKVYLERSHVSIDYEVIKPPADSTK
jgi:hypothetical protein